MKRSATLLAKVIKVYLNLAWFVGLVGGILIAILTPFVVANAPSQYTIALPSGKPGIGTSLLLLLLFSRRRVTVL